MNLIPWRSKKKTEEETAALTTPASRLRAEMDELFDRFFRDPWDWREDFPRLVSGWTPALDVVEGDSDITVRVELPGIDPKAVDVSVSGNVLTVTGEKRESTEHKDENCHHSECRYGSFRRSVELPPGADPDQVSAEHANGVLTVRLKNTTRGQSRHVPVKVLPG